MNRKARRPSSAVAIDAAQCKRIWVQDKPPEKGRLLVATAPAPNSRTARSAWPRWKFCLSGAHVWTSKFYPAMGLSLRSRRFD
jgi:hypothetical protein